MSTLTGKTPQQTYKDLLQVSNNNQGIDSVSRQVSDGEGTTSPLQLSITKVQAKGSGAVFEVANSSGTVLFEVDTTTNTITAKSGVSFEGDGSGLTGVLSTGVGGASATVDLEMLADSDNNGSGDLIFKIGTKEVGRIPNTYAQSLPVGVAGQYFLLPTGWASPDVGAKYDGSTQYSITSSVDGVGGKSGFIEAYFKFVKTVSSEAVTAISLTSVDDSYLTIYKTNNDMSFYVITSYSDTPAHNELKLDYTFDDDTIYHIIVGSNGSSYFAYVNGVPISLTLVFGNDDGKWIDDLHQGYNSLQIGRKRSTDIMYITADIYKVKYFNYLPSQSDVDARWNNGDPMGFVEPFETREAVNEYYTSDFSAGVDGWSGNLCSATGNIDNITDDDSITYNDVLKASKNDSSSPYNNIYKAILGKEVGKLFKVTFDVYFPTTNTSAGGISLTIDGNGYNAETISLTGGKISDGSSIGTINGSALYGLQGHWTRVTWYAKKVIANVDRLFVSFVNNSDAGVTTWDGVTDSEVMYVKNIQVDWVGNVADWDFTNGGVTGVIDGSLNGNHLQHVNSPIALNSEIRRDVKITVTGDTTLTDVIPASHKLKSIVAEETAGGTVTMNIGSSAAGTDIVNGASIIASGITNIETNYVGSLTAATSMFISSSAWGTASIDLILQLEKI